MEPWGGLIETPNIRRLAERGLTYTNWHTTALCSPTRSSLLTGRNHTTNGMACIAEAVDLELEALAMMKRE
jgi:arylsulfatase